MKCVPKAEQSFDSAEATRLMQAADLDTLARVFQALGSPSRLRICYELMHFQSVCVCDLAAIVDLSVPATSHHLAKLKALGLVRVRRQAQTLFYEMAGHPLWELLTPIMTSHETAVIGQ